MTSLLVGLLVCVGVAVAVIVLVALPHLREGSPILTPEGERLAEEARRRATATAGALREKVTSAVTGTEQPAPGAEKVANASDGASDNPSDSASDGQAAGQSAPPRQVASAAATPAPGTPLVVEDRTQEQLDRLAADSRS